MSNNRVVRFEILANEPESLTKFYNGLFGWKLQKGADPWDGILAVRHRLGWAGDQRRRDAAAESATTFLRNFIPALSFTFLMS